MIDSQDDFFVTGKVIDYLNYKSYIDNKKEAGVHKKCFSQLKKLHGSIKKQNAR